MTLRDAPQDNAARERRNFIILISAISTLITLFIVWWVVCGHPLDWPWNWDEHLFGTNTVNRFLTAVEQNDMQKAYGVWFNDPNWQQHPNSHAMYTFKDFLQDWSPTSGQNEYGPIHSHKIAAERISGNVMIVGIYINGQKKNPLFLAYDPKNHTLSYSPVELYLGPFMGLKGAPGSSQ